MTTLPPPILRDLSSAEYAVFETNAAFGAAFAGEFRGLRSRFLKFEARLEYQEPENPSYRLFQEGNIAGAAAAASVSSSGDAEFARRSLRSLVLETRLRVVPRGDVPPYLSWELGIYKQNALWGERIAVIDIERARAILGPKMQCDFMLFDDRVLMVNRYNASGLMTGGWRCDRAAVVTEFVTAYKAMLEEAQPLAEYLASSPRQAAF